MILNSFAALFGFLFLVAPGVAYELHREQRRPAVEDSTFREASRVALWSLLFTMAALVVLALARPALSQLLPDPRAWLADQDYARHNPTRVGWFIVLEVALAQFMAWTLAVVAGRHAHGRIYQGDLWHKAFAADVPKGRLVQALVLTDNAEYRGTVVGFTVNADVNNRELELRDVTVRQRHEQQPRLLPAPFDRVVIASTAIRELWLHYRVEMEPSQTWWKRLTARLQRRIPAALREATLRARP